MRSRRGVLAFIALLAIAANLRAPLTSLPPLVDGISRDLALSRAQAGALTSLPVVCMGLLAPLAPRLAARYGLERAIGLGIALIGVGTAGRALAGAPGLYTGTVVLGAGIAITGALVPAAVRQAVPDNVGGASSGANVVTMTVASLAAATVSPLADWLGWPATLALWSLPAAAAFVTWVPRMRESAPAPVSVYASLPWRSSTAWLITGYLTANSLMFYALMAWLPAAYLDLGWSGTAAGLILGVFSAWQLIAALALTASLHVWHGDRRVLYIVAAGLSLLGMLWVALLPDAAPWVIVGVVGVGLGAGFTLGLVQLAHHVSSAMDSARLSAMAFLVSFLLAAVGPALAGLVRDVTGSFSPSFLALATIATVQMVIATRLHPRRRVGIPT